MCQRIVSTFLLLLLVCSACAKEATNRKNNTNGNMKNTRHYKQPINGLKFTSRKLTNISMTPLKNTILNSYKLKRGTVESLTLKTRTFKSPVLHTINLRRLSKRTPHSSTLRSPTLNSSPLSHAHMLNDRMLNPFIPEDTLNSATLNKEKLDDLYNKNLTEWLEKTIVTLPENYSKDSRRSHVEGLHDFKNTVIKNREESRRRAETFIDNDIIEKDKYILDKLLDHEPVIPNFDESYADVATKKLNEIQSEYLELKMEEVFPSARRANKEGLAEEILASNETPIYTTTTKIKPNPMERILALMDQFISQAHRKLILAQMLRQKYGRYVKFKLGYTFSLLRILKQQQMRIYSSMHFYRFYTPTVNDTRYDTSVADATYYLMLYEKLTRLDDDIVTLVGYMWKLEEERQIQEAIEVTKFPKRSKKTPPLTFTYYIWLTTKTSNLHLNAKNINKIVIP